MKLLSGTLLASVFSIFSLLYVPAYAGFQLYSGQKEPTYEREINKQVSEQGIIISVGAEGETMRGALCNGFLELAFVVSKEVPGSRKASGIMVAGLLVSSASSLSDKVMEDTVYITDGEVYVKCTSKSKDKSDNETALFSGFEYNLTTDGELDLRRSFIDDNCRYDLLEHGYFPYQDYFSVLMKLKCN